MQGIQIGAEVSLTKVRDQSGTSIIMQRFPFYEAPCRDELSLSCSCTNT